MSKGAGFFHGHAINEAALPLEQEQQYEAARVDLLKLRISELKNELDNLERELKEALSRQPQPKEDR